MNCDEVKKNCQLLIDNELNADEIEPLMEHLESCSSCRNEYTGLLKLRKKLNGIKGAGADEQWFDSLELRKGRRFFSGTGLFMLIVSWVLLAGFALFTLLTDPGEGLFVKIVVAAAFLSIIILFITALSDRIKERKTDKYKGVMR